MENKPCSRPRIQLIITEDLLLRSPVWAMIMLLIWGIISYFTIWIMVNIMVPSYQNKISKHKNYQEASYYERDYKTQFN